MTKLKTILDQIDAGSMLLPEFQRGYVWNRDQVRSLMRSLYSGYPVGSLLVWETDGVGSAVRGQASGTAGPKYLLLDGQQRVTSLYGIVRGRPPSFFEGDSDAFAALRFNVETEAFQFHAPVKMKGDPRWVDVTTLFTDGLDPVFAALHSHVDTQAQATGFVGRLQRLLNVLDRDFHIEAITGADKTVDVVVDIFNRVNSGGTKLSKGDLALARICAEWGDARPTMRRNLDRWAQHGYHFTPDWLLRNVNAVATGRAPFSALEDVSAAQFEEALHACIGYVDHFLFELVRPRLGLDHDRVLAGRYAFPVIMRLLHNRSGQFTDGAEADCALYWYINAALRGRFAGSTETFLAKDLETVEAHGIDGVVASLQRSRKGGLAIDAEDFAGVGRGSRSYPLLYLLTRVRAGRDLLSGTVLGDSGSALGVQEIYPKSQLVRHGYARAEVNAVANFAFVEPATQVGLGKRDPQDYLGSCDPAVLDSQWIPRDPELWRVENYRAFLGARRALLADAANALLDALQVGTHPWRDTLQPVAVTEEAEEFDARTAQIAVLVAELVELGYARPALDVEISDPETGRALSVAEAYWPDSLQAGQGSPVVLELDPAEADLPRLAELGFEVFTSVDALRGYAARRSEAAAGGSSEDIEPAAEAPDVDDVPPSDDAGFASAVLVTMDRSVTELGYQPSSLRVMVNQHGAVGAARRLLEDRAVTDGFVLLWERQRLDLSVEALVCDQRFDGLFTEAERAAAQERLDEFGYVLA